MANTTSGVKLTHMTKARISQPAKTAMQSGRAKMKRWKLQMLSDAKMTVDPLMGWTGMPDTLREIDLFFPSKEAAIAYANKHGVEFELVEPKKRAQITKAYSDNFKYTG